MRISFVSDIHGNIDGLARVAERAEHLVVLGDLIDYVDYHEPGNGILGSIFGADRIRPFVDLRSRGEFAELAAYNRRLWDSVVDPQRVLDDLVLDRYSAILDVLPPTTLLTLGNVDVAELWTRVAGERLPYLDGRVAEIGGVRLGFVAGGSTRRGVPRRPSGSVWRPLVRSGDEFAATVDALPPVDVLCSHIPPQWPSLRYDVIPGRMEMFGPGLREYVDRHRPRWAVFGHVHQPLARRLRQDHTEWANVGHFQRHPRAFTLTV